MPAKNQSISELRRELNAKKKAVAKLRSRRAKVARKLAVLDRDIGALVGTGRAAATTKGNGRRKAARPKARRKRASGKPLAAYIQRVLARAPAGVRVKDIMAAVKKAGYKTVSKDFYGIVAKTLLDHDQFLRVKRGIYKLAS